jgi:capsular polysaccharide transport system permease protein
MTEQALDRGGTGPLLAQNKLTTRALAVTSRKLRMATSGRSKIYQAVGLRPKPIDRLMRAIAVALLLFVLIVPNVVAVVYFGFIASDQYAAETRFTVRTSEPMADRQDVSDMSGIPSAQIIQDTQIVYNFVYSKEMLNILEREANFQKVYGRADADWYARLPADATEEDKLDYWESMVDRKVSATSGIVTLRVRAFSAEEAQVVAKVIVKASEQLINDINARIWSDATSSARNQVDAAGEMLSQTRQALQSARNTTGIFTVESSSSSLATLITTLEGERIALENVYQANAKTVSPDAPQMQVLSRQIASKVEQIKALRAQVASETGDGSTLADSSKLFSQLNLEQQMAEERLADTVKTSETLQYLSQQQMMYLEPFLAPTLPDSAEYPRRLLWIGIVAASTLLLYGVSMAIFSVARMRVGS